MKRLEKIKTQLFAVEILKTLKKEYSHKELSKLLGLHPTVMSRYINGHILPSFDRSEKLIKIFKKGFLVDLVKRRVSLDKNGSFDHSRLLADTEIMYNIANTIFNEFSYAKVNKIMTVETDGIPLAMQVGKIFGCDTLILKRRKEPGIKSFIEVKRYYDDGMYDYFYLPKKLIRKNDNVLIIDDVLRSGATKKAMVKLCNKSKSRVSGAYFILSKKETLRKVSKEFKFPVKTLIKF